MAASPNQPTPIVSGTTAAQRQWAMLTHLVGVLSALSFVGVIGLFASAVMWRLRHNESEFLDDHGREATNFQISILIYNVAFTILAVALPPLGVLGVVVVGALTLYGCVRAARASNRAEYFRYPATIRFISGPDDAGAARAECATPY